MDHAPLPSEIERMGKSVVESTYAVHSQLGPGLLENIYETCFCHELAKRNLKFKKQVNVPIIYDGIKFDNGLRLDGLVEDLVICELKAVEILLPVFKAQLLSQLKLTDKRLEYLINFNVPVIKPGIHRMIR